MKVNWGAFFSKLPVLVSVAEQIYTDVKAGVEKKASVLQLIGVSASDAAAATPAILDPTKATIAQAVSGEIDNIVAGNNAGGWPDAIVYGTLGIPGLVQAIKPPTTAPAPPVTPEPQAGG